jgi:hypothetical protein
MYTRILIGREREREKEREKLKFLTLFVVNTQYVERIFANLVFLLNLAKERMVLLDAYCPQITS